MPNFDFLIPAIKGTYGEMIVRNRLIDHEYSVLFDPKPKSHPFDLYIQREDEEHIKVEVKVTQRMDYPRTKCVGIDRGDNLKYITFQKKYPTEELFMLFVDCK